MGQERNHASSGFGLMCVGYMDGLFCHTYGSTPSVPYNSQQKVGQACAKIVGSCRISRKATHVAETLVIRGIVRGHC